MLKKFLPVLLLLTAISLSASALDYPPEIVREGNRIAAKLRCPVCRGIPIAESPSELAQDMMRTIYARVAAGESEEQILAYFESRYGEWILLDPKREGLNWILWLLPAAALVFGGALLAYSIRKWQKKAPHESS